MAKQLAKSPYNKYGKHPYRYSTLYQDWRNAMLDERYSQAAALGVKHTEAYFGKQPVNENQEIEAT